jgi:methionine aminopeptidase
MYEYAEKSKVNPSLKKSFKGLSPNMPLGKIGRGIESYSKLDDPRVSPISNFYCRGYMDIKEEVDDLRYSRNKTDLKNKTKIPHENQFKA